MGKRTPLYDRHLADGARIVDFGGWDMPVHYGSQIEEHHAVRRDAGMFDVSHMGIVELTGERVREFLSMLLANNVAKLKKPGKALYGCMLLEDGGVIDDLIVYFLDENHFRMVINAATRDKDLQWIRQKASTFDVEVQERDDLAMIAVQGPSAREKAGGLMDAASREIAMALPPFFAAQLSEAFAARTGYTGEDGWELMIPVTTVNAWWERLTAAGVVPCGLGARDTLRLEAGMNLYGADMDESTTPLESGLAWTVAWEPEERDFIGRAALEQQRAKGVQRKLVGLMLKDRGILRSHQKVIVDGVGEGEVTSGGFSPSLNRSIALARVPAAVGESVRVDIRGKLLNAEVVKPPFVRHGKACVEL